MPIFPSFYFMLHLRNNRLRSGRESGSLKALGKAAGAGYSGYGSNDGAGPRGRREAFSRNPTGNEAVRMRPRGRRPGGFFIARHTKGTDDDDGKNGEGYGAQIEFLV